MHSTYSLYTVSSGHLVVLLDHFDNTACHCNLDQNENTDTWYVYGTMMLALMFVKKK